MMSFSLSGGVEVYGFIAPTEITDEYPVIDPLYGIDGFRNVNTLSDLNSITNLRRRAGMVVGIGGGTQYYKLNPGPWNGTITDWTIFNSGGGGTFTGGTVTGDTIFTQGVTATTFSASTYLGLPLDVYTTGFTYNNNTFTISDTSGNTFSTTIDTMTGLTVNGVLSATTYQNLPQYYAGVISGSTNWVNNNDGSITLPNLQVALFSTPDFSGPLNLYDISSTTFVLNNEDTNYIGVDYNGGSPIYFLSNNDGLVNDSDVILYLIVYRSNNFLHILEFGDYGSGLPNKLNDRVLMTDRFAHESGCILGLSGTTGVVILTDGVVWNGVNREIISAVTSNDGVFFQNYHVNGNWVYTTTASTLNNEFYDDGTNLVSATTGNYLVNWYFRGQEVNDHLYEVFGNNEYVSVAAAELSLEPLLPELITSHAFIVGRIIVGVGQTTGLTQTAFVTPFVSTQVTNHNDLLGLQGGGPGEYYHLSSNEYNNLAYTNVDNNFSVDQTINGGLTAIAISATTIGTSGDCVDDIYVSNIHSCSPLNINPLDEGNVYFGSTSGVTIDLTNNRVGIGTSTPSQKLEVNGDAIIRNVFIGQIPAFGINYASLSHTSRTGTNDYSFLSDNSGITYINAKTSNSIRFRIDNIDKVIIDSNGNLGVGTTSPSEQLDVNGKIKTTNLQVTSGPTSGYVLTSDSSGNATWQTPTTFTGGTVNGLTATTISGGTLYGDGSNLTGLSSGLNVGTTQITNGISGRVLFQSGTTLQQDGSFNWDNTNKRLSIGQGSSPGSRLDVRAQGNLSTDIVFRVRNSGDTSDLISFRGDGSQWIQSVPFIHAGNLTGGVNVNQSLYLGYNSTSLSSIGTRNVIIGTGGGGTANGNNNVSIGYNTSFGSFNSSIIIGSGAVVSNNNSCVMGSELSPFTSMLIGTGAFVQSAANVQNMNLIVPGVAGGFTSNTSAAAKFFKLSAQNGSGNGEGAPIQFATAPSGSVGFTSNANVVFLEVRGDGMGLNHYQLSTPRIPSSNITDGYIQYSADRGGTAGRASAHFRSEDGTINVLGDRTGINTSTPQARLHVANADTTLTTGLFSGSGQNILTVIGSGSTQPLFTVQGSSGELFSITDSLVGSLFSVNDISGLPILEVFSDNTTLMGSYLAPSLNTTSRVVATTGTTNVYSIPTSAYTGAFFDYTVSDGTNLRAGNIMSIWSGSSVNITETQTTDFGNTSGLTFNMVVSSGNAILRTSGVTGNWTVKTIVRGI